MQDFRGFWETKVMSRVHVNKVCIVIPTYNEAENLPKLIYELNQVLHKRDFTVIVVDDNSLDGTAEIAEKLCRRYGNILVDHRTGKLGIGSAFSDGIETALSYSDCEHIITMDADLSHHPADVPRLLKKAENADVVQASRYVIGGGVIGWSLSRRVASFVANSLSGMLFGTGLHEHTTSFRVYSRGCAEAVIKNVRGDGYEWLISSILVARDHGYQIEEIPIVFTNRVNGKSKLKLRDAFGWILALSHLFIMRQFAN
jgi:dolichol-phosphate mannosyltransferase